MTAPHPPLSPDWVERVRVRGIQGLEFGASHSILSSASLKSQKEVPG
jgi:hypothetical protein